MTFYMIRLKRYPDRYIGQRNITYALKSDYNIDQNILYHLRRYKDRDEFISELQIFIVARDKAKVWNDINALKRSINRCKGRPDDTFSEYEVAIISSGEEIIKDMGAII